MGKEDKYCTKTSKLNFSWAETGIIGEVGAFLLFAYFLIWSYCSFAALFFNTVSILFCTIKIFFIIEFSTKIFFSFSFFSLLFSWFSNFSFAATKSKAPSIINEQFNNLTILILNPGSSTKDICLINSKLELQVLHFNISPVSLLYDL